MEMEAPFDGLLAGDIRVPPRVPASGQEPCGGNKAVCILNQNENNLFHDRSETVRCLWFLWCEDLTCDWLQHNEHSRHILGVHANIITAVRPNVVPVKALWIQIHVIKQREF